MSSQAVAGPSGLRGRKDPVRPADIEQGRILWLPPTVRLVKAIIEGNGRPRFPQVIKSNPEALPSDNHYDHPIVVLSRPADDPETMHFAVCTTFHGQDVASRFPREKDIRFRQFFLATAPTIPHPLCDFDSHYETLNFMDKDHSPKAGYVNIGHIYSMSWSLAEHFWNGSTPRVVHAKFDPVSMERLLLMVRRKTAYRPSAQYGLTQPFVPTTSVPNVPVTRNPSSLLEAGSPIAAREPAGFQPHFKPIGPTALYANMSESRISTHQNSERQPLLPSHRGDPEFRSEYSKTGFVKTLWAYLKKTRIGIIIRFLLCRDC